MTPDPAHSAWPETAESAATLEKALHAAGLYVRASVQGANAIVLDRLRYSDATLLETLIRSALNHANALAEELRQALLSYGIDTTVRVQQEKTYIGELTIPQVDALALALGAAPHPTPLDEDDYFEDAVAESLCARLADVSETAIGVPLTGDLHPFCRHEDPELALHALTADTTRRLITALDNATKSD
ncbi:hypothetical protein [Streptomyces catenulae]|uniref:Uncharacterized protein n=1 Tax=Streptomyces catenulae TaxID=66875 RepID=A0ABV2YTH9_9ACTN|nr:hypothetical protein [Streptomyces catenulae]